jgi:hypothetical protein
MLGLLLFVLAGVGFGKYVEGDLHSLEIPNQEERVRAFFHIPAGEKK